MKSSSLHIAGHKVSFHFKAVPQPVHTVIFIHGFPFNKNIWHNQLTCLPAHVQALAYDIRGHGASTRGKGYFSIDLFAQDLITLIEALHLDNVVLCGVSMGGYIALRALELDPKNIVGVVLSDSHSLADSNDIKSARFEGIKSILEKGKEAYAENFIKKLFALQTEKHKPDVMDLIKGTILKNTSGNICATLLALASRTDTTASLKSIAIPTLVMRGQEDQLVAYDVAYNLHKSIKNSSFSNIEGSGHLPALENPDKFNALLNDFLRTV